jgi:hypothetical protein
MTRGPAPASTRERAGGAGAVGRLARVALGIVAAMALVEVVNTARLLAAPGPRSFPKSYVSQGVYTLPVFLMPLSARTGDSAPSIEAARRSWIRDGDLYGDFERVAHSFIYPPTAALELLPFGAIAHAAGPEAATRALDLAVRLSVLATVIASLVVLRRGVGDGATRAFAIGALVLLLAFYPLRWMTRLVQVQALITLLLVVALLAYGRGRAALAGVAVGLAAGLKPHYAGLVVFAALRREWRFAAWAAATGALLVAASAAWLGFEPWRVYVRDIMPVISVGYAYVPNQSVNGIAHRWLGHTPEFAIPEASAPVAAVTLAATVGFAVLAVLPRGRGIGPAGDPRDRELARIADLGLAVLGFSLASPIVWDHHYAWTLVLFAACAALGARRGCSGAWWVALGAGYVLLGAYLVPFAPTPGPASLANALPFAGALALVWAAWRAAATRPPAAEAA